MYSLVAIGISAFLLALLLPGAVEGDALLSAIDLLTSSGDEPAMTETLPEIPEMPADNVSDMPR